MIVVAALLLILALIPALTFARNLSFYNAPEDKQGQLEGGVSVLVPARNEESNIGHLIESVLATEGVEFELLILDDASEDATAAIVNGFVERDPRVRLIEGGGLASGWCGKQYACWRLAQQARYERLLFVDADLRLAPDALRRLGWYLDSSKAALISGVPRQETETFMERLIIPLIHFVLLGFLPVWRMRDDPSPAFGAGCGQLFMAEREAYFACGGHESIKGSRHDGIKLPRSFRAAGFLTDLCDVTALADCRMYRGASEVWNGFLKNADEGLAKATLIGPATVLLLGGQVLPLILFIGSLTQASPWLTGLSGMAVLCSYLPRILGIMVFKQGALGALLHPVAVLVFVVLQWVAFMRSMLGLQTSWKGRVQGALGPSENVFEKSS